MSSPEVLIAQREPLQSSLLAWYLSQQRALPWREKPSLYKTVVSEFMLQQTQVKTVLPYFARWLETFPDFASLAAAPEEQVLKQWEGLGYYSRARRLQALARALVAMKRIPQEREAWLELPGVGPYSSAAITSIAFGTPAACVDGNVVRILTRLLADATPFRDSSSAAKAYAEIAQQLVNHTHPGNHNQAMMELGATVCTKAKPLCLTCPLAKFCQARKHGDPERYPQLAPKLIEQTVQLRVWCVRDKKILLHRATASSRRLAHLCELPTPEQVGIKAGELEQAALLFRKTRSITRFRITELIYELPQLKLPTLSENLQWVPLGALAQVTLSGPHRRWVEMLLKAKSQH